MRLLKFLRCIVLHCVIVNSVADEYNLESFNSKSDDKNHKETLYGLRPNYNNLLRMLLKAGHRPTKLVSSISVEFESAASEPSGDNNEKPLVASPFFEPFEPPVDDLADKDFRPSPIMAPLSRMSRPTGPVCATTPKKYTINYAPLKKNKGVVLRLYAPLEIEYAACNTNAPATSLGKSAGRCAQGDQAYKVFVERPPNLVLPTGVTLDSCRTILDRVFCHEWIVAEERGNCVAFYS